jgi:hypothetical protein
MKRLLVGAALLAGLACAPASATTIDFLGFADGGLTNGTVVTVGSTDITFSASYGADDAYAYFDDKGGLGVCQVLDGDNECVVANDDNLNMFEQVTMSFDTAQTVSNLSFLGMFHMNILNPNRTLMYSVNGGAYVTTTFGALSSLVLEDVTSISFAVDPNGSGWHGLPKGKRFYVSGMTIDPSPIPLPAGALLVLTGLGALGLARRRKIAA